MANFKKVLAAVLSAAMVLTLAPVGATSVQAATKATAGTSTLKVSASKATLKVGAKKTIKITVNKAQAANLKVSLKSSKAAVAKVAAKTTIKKGAKTATFKIVAKKAGKANITVSYKTSANKTVKKTIKVTVKAVETNDDNVDVTDGKITLVDQSGLQTDGTGRINDTLRVDIPQTLGTMTSIIWYRDGNQLGTSSANGDGNAIPNLAGTITTGIAGEYYAVAVTAKGTTYKSNSIKLVETEAAAVIESFTIEDDYTDGGNVIYNSSDTDAVVTVVLNKAYSGTLGIYRKVDTKYASVVTEETTTTGGVMAAVNTKPTNKIVADLAAGRGQRYIDLTNGKAMYKFRVAAGLTRGTEYVVTFNQDSIATDTPGSGTANVCETSATAPYVTAPAKIAVTKVSNGNKPEVTFYDKDNAVLGWLGLKNTTTTNTVNGVAANGGTTALSFGGFNSAVIYKATSNTTTTTASGVSKNETVVTGELVKGVWTATVPADSTAYWFAYVKADKGIYGADALELTSETTKIAQDAATDITIKQNSTTATTATVGFSNLRADGTLYIVKTNGRANATNAATSELQAASYAYELFDPTDPTTYAKSTEVKAGTLTVDVEGAISKPELAAGGTAGVDLRYANGYLAVFIPTDEANYGKVFTSDATATGSVAANWAQNSNDPATAFSTTSKHFGLWVSQALAKYELNSLFGTKKIVGASGTQYVVGTGLASAGTASGQLLIQKDQFGDVINHTAGKDTNHTWNLTKTTSEGAAAATVMTVTYVTNAGTYTPDGTTDNIGYDTIALSATMQVANTGALTNGETWTAVTGTKQTLTFKYEAATDSWAVSIS